MVGVQRMMQDEYYLEDKDEIHRQYGIGHSVTVSGCIQFKFELCVADSPCGQAGGVDPATELEAMVGSQDS